MIDSNSLRILFNWSRAANIVFPPHRCLQCSYCFTSSELISDRVLNPSSKTITCPVCGVENVRKLLQY